MKLTNKVKFMITAVSAAASFLNAAPVMAAPQTTENNIHVSAPFVQNVQGMGMTGYINMNDSAVTVKSGVIEKDGVKMYVNEFGQKETGLVNDNGVEYFFTQDGDMKTGWVKDNGKWYYFNQDGERQIGEIEDGGKTYIVNEDGTYTTGWVQNDEEWSYFNEEGARVENTTASIEGVNYKFDENGVWVKPVETESQPAGDLDRYQMIANAAIAQIGVNQDCTMLVTNALRAVGINFHGAPEKYLSLGPVTSNPVPGDIIVYQGHVAIYIGNGRAIHGGWNGYTTVEWSVECANPFIAFVHPILP